MVHNFPDHKRGDTFKGASFTITTKTPPATAFTALDLTGAKIRMQFRENTKTGPVALELSSLPGQGITITFPLQGKFSIDARIIDIKAGYYEYDIEITLASGVKTTYVEGSITIIQDVTR